MTHLMLTSALLFALLAVVAIAIGASLGIARDLMLDGTSERTETGPAIPSGSPPGLSPRQGHGLAEDFGLGLQHATHFAQDPGRSFSRNRSFSARV